MPCGPHVFLPPSLAWFPWERKALPHLDSSWAPQVLLSIGRLISNLVSCACMGRRCPKGSLCLAVRDQPCLICVLSASLFVRRVSPANRLLVLSSGESCLQAQHSGSLLWRAWDQILTHYRCDELDKLSISKTRGLRTGGRCPSLTRAALANPGGECEQYLPMAIMHGPCFVLT